MATDAPIEAEPVAPSGPVYRLYRLTTDQYDAMIRHGIFERDEKVELHEGLLVAKMTKNDPHILVVKLIRDAFGRALPVGWHVAQEAPVAIRPRHMPEPDVAIIHGSPRDYAKRKPNPADCPLLVEVADSSLAKNRRKLAIYAAGVPVTWLANLPNNQIEVYGDPTARRSRRRTGRAGSMAPPIWPRR